MLLLKTTFKGTYICLLDDAPVDLGGHVKDYRAIFLVANQGGNLKGKRKNLRNQ